MDTTPPHGPTAREQLTPAEQLAVAALVATAQSHDGHGVKLNTAMLARRPTGQANDFCWYDHGTLVGYAPLDPFGPSCELTAIVHPAHCRQGLARALVASATAETRRRGLTELLLVNVRESASGRAFAAAHGLTLASGEYHLALTTSTPPTIPPGPWRVRQAGPADLDALVALLVASFATPDDEARTWTAENLTRPGAREYVAELDGTIVGKLAILPEDGGIYLRAFGVLPAHRGRGHGRHLLAATIATLHAAGHRHFSLDVATTNRNALGLYESCGFRVITAYEYYDGLLARYDSVSE